MSLASNESRRRGATELPDYSDYAGCWIALVSGQVVATGKSAREALLNFRMQRLKDDLVLRWIPPRPEARPTHGRNEHGFTRNGA